MEKNLGFLEEIGDLRTVWPKEASDFTPWLAANIGRLSKAVGIDIDIEETESAVEILMLIFLQLTRIPAERLSLKIS